jgi:hypothetical protein
MPSFWDRVVEMLDGTEFRRGTELELKAQSVFGVKIHAGGRLLSLEQPSQVQLWLTAGAGLGLNSRAASKYQKSIYPKLQATASLVEIGTVETSRMAFPSLETKILLQVPHIAVVNGQRISQIALVVNPFDLNTPMVILKAGFSNDIETPALITRRLPFPVSLGGGYHRLLITTMHIDAEDD